MSDGFFDNIYQIDIEAGGPGKVPIFYREARSYSGIFAANWFKLRKLMPDWRYFPAQVLPGVGAVGFSVFEYIDSDIGPYNEFSISIVLNSPHLAPIPGYNMLRQYFLNGFDVYIHHLPVTTEKALRWGVDLGNYPKFLGDIDFTDTSDQVACDIRHEGKRICKLTSKKLPATRSFNGRFICRLYQDGQPQHTELTLKVNEAADRWLPKTLQLELGDHEIARNYRSILLSTRPLMHLYWANFEACLFGPENMRLPLINYTLQQTGAIGKPQSGPKPSAVTEHHNW
jgi:hypothetical protein